MIFPNIVFEMFPIEPCCHSSTPDLLHLAQSRVAWAWDSIFLSGVFGARIIAQGSWQITSGVGGSAKWARMQDPLVLLIVWHYFQQLIFSVCPFWPMQNPLWLLILRGLCFWQHFWPWYGKGEQGGCWECLSRPAVLGPSCWKWMP